jgi:hypothetical protein
MTIKSFKAKFLKQEFINKKAIIANIEWSLKTGTTTQGTIMRESERAAVECLLQWCKSKTPSVNFTFDQGV